MTEIKLENNKFKEIWENFKKSKKAQIITIIVLALIILAIILGLFATSKSNLSNTNSNNFFKKTSKQVYSLLTGEKIDAEKADSYPIAIVIENYKDVRPQVGLSEAGVIYETLAEGGITRFLAIYNNGSLTKKVGPVRSARHYFVDLAEEYGGIFAHIGASPQAYGVLEYQDYITDLNQFAYSQYYWRDEEVAAPHNLFTSNDLMMYAVRDMVGEDEKADYKSWIYSDTAGDKNKDEADNIKIDFGPGEDYDVEWKYDDANGVYLRYNGGVEHKDGNSNEQLKANNVIIQKTTIDLMEAESGRLDVITQGTGQAYIFINGKQFNGTWKKENRGDRTVFYDKNNKEIELARGKTWIEIIGADNTIEIKNHDININLD